MNDNETVVILTADMVNTIRAALELAASLSGTPNALKKTSDALAALPEVVTDAR